MFSYFKSQLGILFGLGFCVATAVSTTLIHASTLHLNPFFSLFCTTLLGIVYFNVLKIKKLKSIYRAANQEKYLWMWISIFVAGNWITAFYALSKINSFVYIFTYFSSSAMLGSFFEWRNKKSKINLQVAFALMILLAVSIFHLAVDAKYFLPAGIGILSTLISAGFGYGYRHTSMQFSKKTQLDAVSVLSVRFYLLLILSLCLSPFSAFHVLTASHLFYFAMLSAVTFLIPLYCMQQSVLLIGANYFSILTALCPALTATLLLLFYHVHNNFYFAFSFILFCVLCWKSMSMIVGVRRLG